MTPPPSRPRSGGTRRPQHTSVSPHRSQPPVRPAEVRRGRRHLLLALYIAVLAECTAALLTSPRLGIRRVTVQGTGGLRPHEAAEITRRCAAAAGRNFLLVPIEGMQQRLERLPWVLTARLTRHLPDQIQVQIRPRTPVLLAQIGAKCYEVDREQMPIRPVAPVPAIHFETSGPTEPAFRASNLKSEILPPRVVLEGVDTVRCGERLHEEGLAAAIQIVQGLGRLQGGGISKIVVDRSRNLCLNMQDGLQFRIGQTDAIGAKIDYVRQVYSRRPDVARTLALIDLTCPSAPVGKIRAVPAMTETAPDPGRFN